MGIQYIRGSIILTENQKLWKGGKHDNSLSFLVIQQIFTGHDISMVIFLCVRGTILGNFSLHEVNKTTAISLIFLGNTYILEQINHTILCKIETLSLIFSKNKNVSLYASKVILFTLSINLLDVIIVDIHALLTQWSNESLSRVQFTITGILFAR